MLRNLIELIEQKLLLEINIIILGRVFFFLNFFEITKNCTESDRCEGNTVERRLSINIKFHGLESLGISKHRKETKSLNNRLSTVLRVIYTSVVVVNAM